MLSLILFLVGQNGLGTMTVEASEILSRKPKFTFQMPNWVTDEYLFNLAAYNLDDELEPCIDATILTSHLGGPPLNPSLLNSYKYLEELRVDMAMKTLATQLDLYPSADIRRQILFYRIIGDWLGNNLKGARESLKTLKADKEASAGVNLDKVDALLSYWDGKKFSTKDSLIYYLLLQRDEQAALRFIPQEAAYAAELKYHLDSQKFPLPKSDAKQYLQAHNLLNYGRYSEAEDSLKNIYNTPSFYQALIRYDIAKAYLHRGNYRKAHLAVPDTFNFQWMLPQPSLALIRGRKEWMQGRSMEAKAWFKKAQSNSSYDLYSQWIMSDGKYNQITESYFAKKQAAALYKVLRIVNYLRKGNNNRALPLLEDIMHGLNTSSPAAFDYLVIFLYSSIENEAGNYQLTLGLSDFVKSNAQNLNDISENYFITASHLALADAYYYSGGRYAQLARPFYKYCSKSRYDDLRQKGKFGLAWSYLGARQLSEVKPILSSLKSDNLSSKDAQLLIFLEGLLLYSEHDFHSAAEVFAGLNFSSVPEMRMQGLYYEARSYEQSSRPGLAASAYDDLLNDFPAEPAVRDAWTRLARSQVQMGALEQAGATLERLIEQGKLHHFSFVDLYREILLTIFDAAMERGEEEQAREMAEKLSRTQSSTLALETYYYRLAEKDTLLHQTDHLIGLVQTLEDINAQSVYLPELLLKLARMETELADYDLAIDRLERIIEWRHLADVNYLLPEVSFELVRIQALDKNWDELVRRSDIFLRSYPNNERLTPRILYFRALGLVNRRGNNDPFKRKEDARKALDDLDRLERKFAKSKFVKQSVEDIRKLREAARKLLT